MAFSICVSQKNVKFLVIGQDIPNLKIGALSDAQDIVANSPQLQSLIVSYNKTDRIYTFRSGSTMMFKSFKDRQDAKSGKREYSFFNEVNGIPKPIFEEIELRTTLRTWVDYNPNEEFWIHTDYVNNEPEGTTVKFIRSWHEHNPFLSEKMHRKIEGLKHKDDELFKVYARGMTGKIEGLVFRKWTQQSELPENAEYIASGLDFGFTNDQSAVVDVYRFKDELWLEEKLYADGLTATDLGARLKKNRRYIYDSARPDIAEELRRMGLKVEASMKHLKSKNQKGSIGTGIDILKRYNLNLIGPNLVKEFKAYKWKVDRVTDKPTNEPVDFMNHAIDAARYVALNKLLTNKSGKYNMGVV